MKRSKPIARRSPLSRGTAPRRKTRVKRVNRKRKAENFRRAYGGKGRVEWIKTQPCIVFARRFRGPFGWGTAQCFGAIENAHTVTGGASRKAGAETVIPLCRWHHSLLHRKGRAAFEDQYGVSLTYEAARIEQRWQSVAAGRAEPSGGEDE